MELFVLTFTPKSDMSAHKVYQNMLREFSDAHNRGAGLDLMYSPGPNGTTIHCHATSLAENERIRADVYERTSQILARFVIEDREPEFVRSIVAEEFDYRDETEFQAIEEYCAQLLNDSRSDGIIRRMDKLTNLFRAYFAEQTILHLDGFIRFRLQSYIDQLRDTVEYAIDEFILDRQYQDFIALLKYFVYIQDAKIPVAHLMHQGGHDFILLNEQLQPIETKQVEHFVVETIDKDMNYEDMIVSTLISVSPQKVFIHTRDLEMQVIRTIQQIFEERAQVCTGCSRCTPLIETRKASQDQLHP